MLTVSSPARERAMVPQDSKAWVKARLGHLTGSRMKDVLAVSKRDGKPLEARNRYLMELVAERMTDAAVDHYVTADMQWGLDHECEAVSAYCQITGAEAEPAGFILHPTIEFCGATPDRLIGDKGLIEVKCPRTTTHISWMLAGVVPDEHKPQMILELACTGREWCDFVSYDPRCAPRQRVFIRRFVPTAEEVDLVEMQAKLFLQEVEQLFRQVTETECIQ